MPAAFPTRLLFAGGFLFLIGAPLLSTKRAAAHATDRCPDPTTTSSLALDYQGVETRSTVSSAFVLPGQTLDMAVEPSTSAESIAVHASAGQVSQAGASEWRWSAPAAPGSYTLQVVGGCKADSAIVHAFVMVPASEVRAGYLNGFRIGSYPRPPLRRQATYQPPAGFIEVTPQNQDLFVTPHL